MIYKGLLIIGAVIIWSMMLMAKLAEYDVNYFFFGCASLASISTIFFIIAIGFTKNLIIKSSLYSTILFLITSSPVSLILFVWLYEDFIGRFMKL
ncbi:MAG: hypothetical protein JWN60_1778 [Acidobacteria bacterium]|jgi:hypothetical protein|nr:hypothetical protein [Acidobacteriota bacterium]